MCRARVRAKDACDGRGGACDERRVTTSDGWPVDDRRQTSTDAPTIYPSLVGAAEVPSHASRPATPRPSPCPLPPAYAAQRLANGSRCFTVHSCIPIMHIPVVVWSCCCNVYRVALARTPRSPSDMRISVILKPASHDRPSAPRPIKTWLATGLTFLRLPFRRGAGWHGCMADCCLSEEQTKSIRSNGDCRACHAAIIAGHRCIQLHTAGR